MNTKVATAIAFLAAPIIPAIGFALTSPGLGGGVDASFGTLLGLTFVGYWFALMFTGVFGIPAFLLLNRRNTTGFVSSVFSGAVIGGIAAITIAGLSNLNALSLWCGQGAASGLLFWAVRFALGGGTRHVNPVDRTLTL